MSQLDTHRSASQHVALACVSLSIMSLLGALAFHAPGFSSTPVLRERYDVDLLRCVLGAVCLVVSVCSSVQVVRQRHLTLHALSLVAIALSLAIGGPFTPVPEHDLPTQAYLGVDWLLLDLLASFAVFGLLEKLCPIRPEQPVLRHEWGLDFTYFATSHVFVGGLMFALNTIPRTLAELCAWDDLQTSIASWPFVIQFGLAVLGADLAQYGVHWLFHKVPFLWKFHAVHHSTETLDWLSGSRQHILDMLTVRTAVIAALMVIGFSESVINAYVGLIGFQAVIVHANVRVHLGPLERILVTPNFHHWHHSSEPEAIDKNFAVHFSFIDDLFGTRCKSNKKWPEHYGVTDPDFPRGFVPQLLYPFRAPSTHESQREPG